MASMDVGMQPSARFWNRMAARYARQPVADEAAYRTKLAMTREHLRGDMRLLEFGCGTGSTALTHAPLVAEVLATDLSDSMIAIARDKARAAGIDNVRFEAASIEGLAIPEGSRDMVLGLSILHLLDDRAAALAKVHRMLTPGGLFVSSTPCLADPLKYALLVSLIGTPGRWLGLLPRVAVFRSETLLAEIDHAGFDVEQRWQPAKDKPLFLIARKR